MLSIKNLVLSAPAVGHCLITKAEVADSVGKQSNAEDGKRAVLIHGAKLQDTWRGVFCNFFYVNDSSNASQLMANNSKSQ